MDNEDIYEKAKKKVQIKKAFFYHFLTYAAVIGMLYAIMQVENNGEILPVIIVALSWGIGLAIHYFNAFGTEHLAAFGVNPHWEEDELAQEVERLQRKRELKESLRNEQNLLDDFDRLELREIEKRRLDDDFR